MSPRPARRRRAIGPIEILVVLGLVTLFAAVAWSRLGSKNPTPTAVETAADQLAIDLLHFHHQASMKQATFAVTVLPASEAGPAYYAISRSLGPSLEEPVRETSLKPGLTATATPPRIEFRADGTASSDWQVRISSTDEIRSVELDGQTGVVRILPAN
jgi:hypothetical protein